MGSFEFGNIVHQLLKTVSSGSTITLVNTSQEYQEITGSANQLIQLPDATTCIEGLSWTIVNKSTGVTTVQNSSAVTVKVLGPGQSCTFFVDDITSSNGFTVNIGTAGPGGSSVISGSAIDWSVLGNSGGVYTQTLGANTTFTFSNFAAGQTIVVRLTNTVSNWTVTWPTVKWAGGIAPTMTPGAVDDVYTFIYDGTSFYGSAVQNMS